MKYQGGKYKLRKKIAKIINQKRKECQLYWEPFVGSGWVLTEIEPKGTNIASDIFEPLIYMWNQIMLGWTPPTEITEKDYYYIKEHPKEVGLHNYAFVGFGSSYGGKWWGGYARGNGRNYTDEASRSLIKKRKKIKNTIFFTADYRSITPPKGTIIYCDPPYEDTTTYDSIGEFNTDEFWEIMRIWSTVLECDVYISEYQAPDDFIPLWSVETKTTLDKNNYGTRTENLFTYKR